MITIYTRPGCSRCDFTARRFERAGLPFQLVDVEADPTAADQLHATGHQTLPVVTTGSETWSGLNVHKIDATIGQQIAS